MEYVASLFGLALIASAIRVTMPILLASLGAVYTERGGVVNIGLEGT
ncbi:MAG: ABC transporter permease, partial [Bacillati bacterium ANGP1]